MSRTKKSSKGRVKESASSTPTDVAPQNAGDSADAHQQQVAARIRAGLFAIFAAVSVFITSGSFGVDGNFAFWSDSIGGEQVFFSVPVALLWGIVSVGFIAITLLQLLRGAKFAWRASIGIIAPALVIALLARLLDGTTANLTVFFTSTLSFAIPVGIGALAGIVSERSGILNIAVEGKLLSGAMVGSIASSITGVAIAGPVAGALIGALLSLFLAWLGIRYKVDQIIAGTVINIGALGITSFAYLRILQPYSEYNRPIGIDTVDIPLLSHIPILGPIFFSLSPYFYASVGLILFFTYMIYRTRVCAAKVRRM